MPSHASTSGFAVAPAAPVVHPAPEPEPAAQSQAAAPAPPAAAKDKGKGTPKADSTPIAPAASDQAPSQGKQQSGGLKREGGDNGRGHKKDLQTAPAVQSAAAAPATTTSVPAATPPATTATTTLTPAPVVVEQGHRGRGANDH